jgi:MFS family permease
MSSQDSKFSHFKDFKTIGILLYGMCCLSMFRLSIGVLIPEVAFEFSLNETEASIILSTYLASLTLIVFVGGYFSDKIGRKIILSLGMAVMSSGIILDSFSTRFSWLLFSMLITGIGAGLFIPALYAHIGETLPSSRGLLGGVTNSAYAFGGFMGPLLFGLLTARYNWRVSQIAFGLLILLCSIAIWSIPYERTKRINRQKIPVRSIFNNKQIFLMAFSMMIAINGFVSFTAWTPKFLMDLERFTIIEAGLTFGVFSLAGGLGAIVFGWLSDRFERRKTTGTTSLIVALFSLIYFLNIGYSVNVRIAFSAILGFFFFAYWNLTISAAQDKVEPTVFGSATGFVQNIALAGAAVAPLISGSLISYLGLSYTLALTVAIPYMIHGIIFMLLSLKKT